MSCLYMQKSTSSYFESAKENSLSEFVLFMSLLRARGKDWGKGVDGKGKGGQSNVEGRMATFL